MYVAMSEDDQHAKIARLLLAHPRIDVNKQNRDGETALHKACEYGVIYHVGARLLLSDDRCDVNARDNDGNTPLMFLTRKDDITADELTDDKITTIQSLLQHGADFNHLNKHNESALWLYLRRAGTRPEFSLPRNELDNVNLFLLYGADPNVPAHLLAWAVKFCSLDVCRELLQHGADPNSAFPNTELSPDQHGGKETALHCAARQNSPSKLNLLLGHGAETDVLWKQKK